MYGRMLKIQLPDWVGPYPRSPSPSHHHPHPDDGNAPCWSWALCRLLEFVPRDLLVPVPVDVRQGRLQPGTGVEFVRVEEPVLVSVVGGERLVRPRVGIVGNRRERRVPGAAGEKHDSGQQPDVARATHLTPGDG
jgi:hypothetical protein